MTDSQFLADRFEQNRDHLRAVAYRMLGSASEADDAVQEAWLRLNRSEGDAIDNLGGWLTTVVARVCLDMLRARTSRREDELDEQLPSIPTHHHASPSPEQDALLADSVGLALMVVLDRLAPAERLAFVLHDMFDLSFDEIASIIGRSTVATRQLASRARKRVRSGDAPSPCYLKTKKSGRRVSGSAARRRLQCSRLRTRSRSRCPRRCSLRYSRAANRSSRRRVLGSPGHQNRPGSKSRTCCSHQWRCWRDDRSSWTSLPRSSIHLCR